MVDEFGVLPDPTQLERSGFMGRERVARFLPHDFESTGEAAGFMVDFDSALIEKSKWNSLREKQHISLNKSFYYPGEAIWFSADMLYQNPFYADTLSKLLHVDLYDKNFQILNSEKFQILDGMAYGSLVLPQDLMPEIMLLGHTQIG